VLFKNESKIKFLICGEGAYKESLIRRTNKESLKNVFFNPLLPYDSLPSLLSTADVHLILQKGAAADLVLPSKLTGIAAAGGASIVAAEAGTTLYDTVMNNRIGLIIEPE